jgi:hypothetical protein
LILDREKYRYQKFISDIAGQDIGAHAGRVDSLIRVIRNWLGAEGRGASLPGGVAIARRFDQFRWDLPKICEKLKLDAQDLTFSDYANVVSEWLRLNASTSA